MRGIHQGKRGKRGILGMGGHLGYMEVANFVILIVMSGRCGGDGQPREGMKEGCCKVLVWSLE